MFYHLREGAKFIRNPGQVYRQGGTDLSDRKKRGAKIFLGRKKRGQILFSGEKKGGKKLYLTLLRRTI